MYNVLAIDRIDLLKWLAILLSLVLSSVTFLSLNYLDRFYVEREQLLRDSNFLSGNRYWKHKGSSQVAYSADRLIITNIERGYHKVYQNVSIDAPGYYRFEYDAGVKGVVTGKKEDWTGGNIAIIFRNNAGERTGSHMLTALRGTKRLSPYSVILHVKKEYENVDFAIRLYDAKGRLVVANPVMSKLQEYPFYKSVRISIVIAWLLMVLALTIFALRVASLRQALLAILIGGVAVVGVMLPPEMITDANYKLANALPETVLVTARAILSKIYQGPQFMYPGAEISKMGHLFVFMCLGIFVGWFYKKIGFYFSIAVVVVCAFITETLQVLVEGRSPTVGDLLLDSVGGLFGLTICIVFFWFNGSVADRMARQRKRSVSKDRTRKYSSTPKVK